MNKAAPQTQRDWMSALAPRRARRKRRARSSYRGWGMNRFGLAWGTPALRAIFGRPESWGLDVDICDVPDLAAFLSAVLLVPRSITSSFDFPQWEYHGRG